MIVTEMNKYYKESRWKGISHIKLKGKRLIGLVISSVGKVF